MMSDWTYVKFGSICSHSAFGPRFSSDEYAIDGNVACLRTMDIDSHGRINYEAMPLAKLDLDRLRSHVLKRGDLVITRTGAYLGKVGLFDEFRLPVLAGAFSIRFCVNETVADPVFVKYFFNGKQGQEAIQTIATGSAQPNLNIPRLHSLDIPCPSLLEQRAIVAILSSLDGKIDLLQRQNKTLEAMAETLFRQWFVEEAKDETETVPLGEVLETCSGGTPSRTRTDYYHGGTICWVKSKELNGGFVIDTEEFINEDGLKSSAAKLIPENSILVALYGATVGEYAVLSKPMACNQAVCAIKPNQAYPYTFLFMYFKAAKEELINMAVGSAQQNISQVLIRQLQLPKDTAQTRRFHDATAESFNKMKFNLIQVRILERLRDTLLPKLMSGEVRVQYE